MLNRASIRRAVVSAACGGLGLIFVPSAKAAQVPIDPTGFSSLGTLSGFTNYVVNTGNGSSTPTLTEDGSTVLNGQISNGAAVFDFSSINLSSTSTLTATGLLPLALLSQNGATLAGTINLNASGTNPGAGGEQAALAAQAVDRAAEPAPVVVDLAASVEQSSAKVELDQLTAIQLICFLVAAAAARPA